MSTSQSISSRATVHRDAASDSVRSRGAEAASILKTRSGVSSLGPSCPAPPTDNQTTPPLPAETNAVAGAKDFVEREFSIPSAAAGWVIGKKGVNIKALRSTKGLIRCDLVADGLNFHILRISGTQRAVASVASEVNFKTMVKERNISNASRAIHSYSLDSNGNMLTPREVHQTGKPAPKPRVAGIGTNWHRRKREGKQFDKEKERAQQLREERDREG